MRMTGAEILVNCLIEQDVDTVFGFPGGAVLYIYDALYQYQDKINHILIRVEQNYIFTISRKFVVGMQP